MDYVNVKIPQECFEEIESNCMYSLYTIKNYTPFFYSNSITHMKEIWHDGLEYYSYEFGSISNGEFISIFDFDGETFSIFEKEY